MGEVRQEWLSVNSRRAYPLRDTATRTAVAGERLPVDLLVDAHISLPSSLGLTVFVAAASVSPNLVSVVMGASTNDSCGDPVPEVGFTPIAAISLRRPVQQGVLYPLQALADGVAGWICFGKSSDRSPFSLSFSGPGASGLLERCVFRYDPPGVLSMGPEGPAIALTGLVRLRGTPGRVRVVGGEAVIDGMTRRVAMVGLDSRTDNGRSLKTLAGPCYGRPINDGCDPPVATSLNGIVPDAGGNVDLALEGAQLVTDAGDGLVIDGLVGLAQLCGPGPFADVASESLDPCGETGTGLSEIPESELPEEGSEVGGSSSDPGPSGAYCEEFNSGMGRLEVRKGSFSVAAGELLSAGDRPAQEQFAADLDDAPDAVVGYLVQATIHPYDGGEGHICFGLHGDTDFFLLGVALSHPSFPNGVFFIAKRSTAAVGGATLGDGDPGDKYVVLDGSQIEPAGPLPEDDYAVTAFIQRIGSVVVVDWEITWLTGSEAQSYAIPLAPGAWIASRHDRGRAGLGVMGSRTGFSAFGLDCDGSSELP